MIRQLCQSSPTFLLLITHAFAYRLPVGLAAAYVHENHSFVYYHADSPLSLASCFGIAGAVISMGQTWYVGPIAKKLSPVGGDMGVEFAAIFTGVVYPPLRWLEIRKWGR